MVVIMSSCGFHLRGKVPLPEELKSVYIDSNEHSISSKLGDSIISSGGKLVESPTQASAIIKIYGVNKGRQVKSVSGQGRVREFRIEYAVTIEVKDRFGKTLLSKTSIKKSRDYAFSESEVVGKSREEFIILAELERELIPQILRKLQVIGRVKQVSGSNSN